MFSNFLRSLLRSRSTKASAKPLTLYFLWDCSSSFSSPAVSFSLASMHSCSGSNNSALVNSSGTASRSYSMSSTPRLKSLAISNTALLIFATSSPWQILWSHGQTSWVSSSRYHSYIPWWHHPEPKQGSWCSHRHNPSRNASVSSSAAAIAWAKFLLQ